MLDWNAVCRLSRGLLLLLGLISAPLAQAEEVLRRQRQDVGVERRNDHTNLVLEEAMRRTQKKYGPYRIEVRAGTGGRERLLLDMVEGEKFNTTVMASQPRWEQQLLPIWIPPDMGLSNYRIALIRRDAQARLSAVQTLDELKVLGVGVGSAWASRKVLDANDFNTVLGEGFEPLLKMLMAGRIDYFPRGMNEVFVEYDDRSPSNPDLAIERDQVVEFPLPGYIFVSPKAPRLHQRLSEGMESMVRDGTLLKMVMGYHADMIKRANFCSRRVFRLENPFLSENTPLQRKALWFDPYDPKTGICPSKAGKTAKAGR